MAMATFALLSCSLPLKLSATTLCCLNCLAPPRLHTESLRVAKTFRHNTTLKASGGSLLKHMLRVTFHNSLRSTRINIDDMESTKPRRLTVLKSTVLMAHIASTVRALTLHHSGAPTDTADKVVLHEFRNLRDDCLACESSPKPNRRRRLLPLRQPSMLLQIFTKHVPQCSLSIDATNHSDCVLPAVAILILV